MNRKWIRIMIGIVTTIVVGVFGVLSLTIHHMDETQYQEWMQQMPQLNTTAGFTAFQTLGAWFAVTVMVVLFGVAAAFIVYKRYTMASSILLIMSGLVLLIGTQLLAFPFAFFYFVGGVAGWIPLKEE